MARLIVEFNAFNALSEKAAKLDEICDGIVAMSTVMGRMTS